MFFYVVAETSFHISIYWKHGGYHLCVNDAPQLHSFCCFLWTSGTDSQLLYSFSVTVCNQKLSHIYAKIYYLNNFFLY